MGNQVSNKRTMLQEIEESLVDIVDTKKPTLVYNRLCALHKELELEIQQCENNSIRKHIMNNIIPPISLYKVFIENGSSKKESISIVARVITKFIDKHNEEMSKREKTPFLYFLLQKGMFKLEEKNNLETVE